MIGGFSERRVSLSRRTSCHGATASGERRVKMSSGMSSGPTRHKCRVGVIHIHAYGKPENIYMFLCPHEAPLRVRLSHASASYHGCGNGGARVFATVELDCKICCMHGTGVPIFSFGWNWSANFSCDRGTGVPSSSRQATTINASEEI